VLVRKMSAEVVTGGVVGADGTCAGGATGAVMIGAFSGWVVVQADREITTKAADASKLVRISDIGDSNLCG
jgi:hypothetical protein